MFAGLDHLDRADGTAKKAPSAARSNVRRRAALLAACLLILPPGLAAQTLDLGNGLILDDGEIQASILIENAAANNRHFCMVIVGNPGSLAPAIGNVALSSKVAGGLAGSAQIIATNSSFSADIDAPLSFSNSPNLSGPVTFEAEFSGNGATSFSAVPASGDVRIKRGTTNITADLTATIQGASFVAGQYQAELVLRCE